MATTLTISPLNPSVEVGTSQAFTATVAGAPAESTTVYEWAVNGVVDPSATTNQFSYSGNAGSYQIKVTSTTLVDGQPDDVQTASTTLTVTQAPVEIPEECPLVYVHPLPHRNSAYIWAGWWVMDAIQDLAKAGKDWKTATKEDTPYYCHLAVLAKMLEDYPEVDVQESRNGRIVHKSALDVGIIY